MIAATMTGCSKDTKAPSARPVSYVMVYNGGADFYGASGMVLVNNQYYGSRSYNDNGNGLVGALNFANYAKIDTGVYRIAFTDTALLLENTKKITESIFDLQDQRHYTIYLIDSLGFYQTTYTEDDIEKDPAQAKIRLINLSPDAGEVFCRIDTAKVKDIQPVHYKQVSAYAVVTPDIKPGIRIMYRDRITGEEKLLIRKSFVLEAGKCYTMILRGYRTQSNPNKTINLSTITNF